MLVRDLIEQAFGSLAAQQAGEWAGSYADLLGFVVSPYSAEFRARQAQSFSVGLAAVGANVNPTNFVLFNPAASRIIAIVRGLTAESDANNGSIIFGLAVDPALAAGAVGLNLFAGGPAPKLITELADAVTPANTGVYARTVTGALTNNDLTAGRVWILPPGAGINYQYSTAAISYRVSYVWDELPL